MKSIIRYGVLSGLVVVFISLLIHAFGSGDWSYQTQEILGYLSMLMGLSFVYFGIRHDRSLVLKKSGQTYTFKQGLKTGAAISVLSGLIFGIFTIILFILYPELGDDLIAKLLEGLETPEEVEAMKKKIADVPAIMKTPVAQGLIMFGTVFVIGLIISVLSSLALRTTPKR
ncbi:MAG: DUF4199 domain-containing protein [Bacteroidota bacterium]